MEWIEGSPPVRAGPLPRAAQLQLGGSGGSILRIIGVVPPDPGDGTLFGAVVLSARPCSLVVKHR